MSNKDRWNCGEVWPSTNPGKSPVFDAGKAATHLLGYAAVEGMKFILKEAGETVKFGTCVPKRASDEVIAFVKKPKP